MANQADIRDDLTSAMKAGDRDRVRTLRSLLTAIDNAQSVPDDGRDPSIGVYTGEGRRRELEPGEVLGLVRAEIDERLEALAIYRPLGRTDLVERFEGEIVILSGYLPQTA